MEYTVERQHFGDRLYMPGDKRTASPADVLHLVRLGVLIEVKAEVAPEVKEDKPKRGRK